MYTLERVTKEVRENCAKVGMEVTVPITINSRFTSTYGRVDAVEHNKYCKVVKIQFSKRMLETMTDDFISGVIRHECGHYITIEKTHENHGHDAAFHYWCREIGCSDKEMASCADPEYKENMAPAPVTKHKYDVYCATCGKVIDYRDRMCNLIKYPERYRCNACKTYNIEIVANW